MIKLINDIWFKRRDIVSDGYDESIRYISKLIPMKIHEIPSGTKCWTWTVPEKWSVKEAYIEDIKGDRMVDLKDNPLHVMSYSLPINKIVKREELMKHLYTNPSRPAAIPFEFKYYEKDWGFCVQHSRLKEFKDDSYKVHIDSKLAKGALKVGDCTIKGSTDETIVLAAHLCHPAMVNDGLSGVAVLVDIAKRMSKRKNHYTYKFLIMPETIGSIAYLSQNEKIIPDMRCGIFLEMLGNDNKHALQLTRQGNTAVDRVSRYVFKKRATDFREGAFRKIIVNDEMVFNGPGIDIPMVSISRFPYPEYHTSDDNPGIVKKDNLTESRDIILEILDIMDKDYCPKRKFKGPVFLSGFGLWVDWRSDKKLNENIDHIMMRLEGDRSVFDIAEELDMDFYEVLGFIDKFLEKKLVGKK